jgi:hypothetical protein
LIAQVWCSPVAIRPLVTALSAETVGVESPPPVGADVVPPPPESVVVCSPSSMAQPKEKVAVMMIASKVFIIVPLFAGLDYLAHVCLWNKV